MKKTDEKAQNYSPVDLCHEENRLKQGAINIEGSDLVSIDGKSIVELLAMPAAASIDFEPLKFDKQLFEPADLS